MSAPEPTPPESPLWRFSVGFYSEPEVAPACLALQDAAGVDVNLLMYLLWSAARGRVVATEEVAALDARLAGWRDTAVIPLRTLRRALKGAAPLVTPAAAERFRGKIKGVELEAERLQQEAMYAFDGSVRFTPAKAIGEAARANMAAYQAACRQPFPAAAVDTLLAAYDAYIAAAPGDRRRESA